MRRNHARRALLVALALVLPVAAGGGAKASEADPTWIEQLKPGPVVEDFNVRTVLYNGDRFPIGRIEGTTGSPQRPLGKYLAYGTIEPFTGPEGEIFARVAVSTSDDGIAWSEPEGITIKDPFGIDVPLIVNDPSDHFAVVYDNVPQMFGEGPDRVGLQFGLYYRDASASSGGANDISEFHLALSADGRSFMLDQELSQVSDEPVLGAGFKSASFGPTQIHHIPGGSDNCHTAPSASFPWDCRIVMVYAANGGGLEHVALAGSGNGSTFRGMEDPILSPSAAPAWDEKSVGLATIERQMDGSHVLYYAGHDGASAGQCFGGLSGCFSIGVATSPDGFDFTKVPHNPVVPVELLETFSEPDPATLFYPSAVRTFSERDFPQVPDDLNYFFYNRITDVLPTGLPKRDFFAARRTPAPDQGPRVQILNPPPGPLQTSEPDIVACVSDTLGLNPGIDASTISLDINGTPVLGFQAAPSLQCALKFPAFFIRAPDALQNLGVGTHALTVSAKDHDGNLGSLTVEFSIDELPPVTTLTLEEEDMKFVFPLSSIGTFEGITIDADSAIAGIRALVTNPLRITQVYDARIVQGKISNPTNGFTFMSLDEGEQELVWRWIAPTLDLHLALPGPYTISFVGYDFHNNIEAPGADNTTTLLVI